MLGLFRKKKMNIPDIAEIRMYYGLPRAGKTYCATGDILDNLRRDVGIRVYTNWPVYDAESQRYSFRIDKREDLLDIDENADVYLDEAHFWYNSRLSLSKKGMTEDEMSWYRTIGHRNIRVTLITHHPDRLDIIIRNIVNVFCHVEKKTIPLTTRPLFFNLTYYLSESDMTGIVKNPCDNKTRWFSKKVANAYDTHYFKDMFKNSRVFNTWDPKDIENEKLYRETIERLKSEII